MFGHSVSSTWKPSPRRCSLSLTTEGPGSQPGSSLVEARSRVQGHGGWEADGKETRCQDLGDQLLEARAWAGRSACTYPCIETTRNRPTHWACAWPRAPGSHSPPRSLRPAGRQPSHSPLPQQADFQELQKLSRGAMATAGIRTPACQSPISQEQYSLHLPFPKTPTTVRVLELHEGERALPALWRGPQSYGASELGWNAHPGRSSKQCQECIPLSWWRGDPETPGRGPMDWGGGEVLNCSLHQMAGAKCFLSYCETGFEMSKPRK